MSGKFIIGASTSYCLYLLGGCDVLLRALALLMLVDWITGVLAGGKEKKLSSKIMFKGICRKIMMVGLVVLANQFDILLSQDVFRNVTIMFYIGNESLSIIENAIRQDVPIPSKLKDTIKVFLANHK